VQTQPGGRVTFTNMPARTIIRIAYAEGQDMEFPNSRLIGGPGWLDSESFDIIAKAEDNPSPEQRRQMVKTLLADRFKLRVHTETRYLPIYALVVAGNNRSFGPKLVKSDVDCAALMEALQRGGQPPPPTRGNPPPCGVQMGRGRLTARSVTMSQFVGLLSAWVDRTVTDQTGLSGVFNADLEFTPSEYPADSPWAGDKPTDNGPSIFTALQEQLGLKLEATRGPVRVLVIDGVERPTPD
jgi:uncharacterized protein (TIGR03435 family)